MKCASMTHLSLGMSCFLASVMSLTAVRYGDYSVANMPQYRDQHEDSDLVQGQGQYDDRSPDAPALLDYKYEEEPIEKSDNLPVKDIMDERIWDKAIKKKRKPSDVRGDPNHDVDKYTLEERGSDLNSEKRFLMQRPKFRRRNFVKERHLKHDSIGHRDDIDSVENNRDYVHKGNVEGAGSDDEMDIINFRYRSTANRKARRKPRDRALHHLEWRESTANTAKLEQEDIDARSDREHFEIKSANSFDGIIHQEENNKKNKNNYDYDDYYDMKRVHQMKSRLPALLRQSTVRTTAGKITGYTGHRLNRRADTAIEHSIGEPITGVTFAAPNATSASTTITTNNTTSTTSTKLKVGNSSDLSLAEKSRLSILKKAQKKESLRYPSLSTKPPVLMQVTRKMQTLVMVEPRSVETALRARDVVQDSSERLRRARRLMRQKLVAGARSIHELTDNWDEMICDYIDVSLLDTDASCYVDIDRYILSYAIFTVLVYL